MKILTLYSYKRLDGGTTVTPVKPEGAFIIDGYRLVADEGKVLVKDDIMTSCIDVKDTSGWEEIDEPEEEE